MSRLAISGLFSRGGGGVLRRRRIGGLLLGIGGLRPGFRPGRNFGRGLQRHILQGCGLGQGRPAIQAADGCQQNKPGRAA